MKAKLCNFKLGFEIYLTFAVKIKFSFNVKLALFNMRDTKRSARK